jgi:hypothetical protein
VVAPGITKGDAAFCEEPIGDGEAWGRVAAIHRPGKTPVAFQPRLLDLWIARISRAETRARPVRLAAAVCRRAIRALGAVRRALP